jgi:surface carbohydrate biosynthesis protein (TIGR04326 family)
MVSKNKTLILLEQGNNTDEVGDPINTVYWDTLAVPQGASSLPVLVDEYGEQLRNEYADWCSNLSETQIGRKTVTAWLSSKLLFGGSFWWTTLIAERCPLSSAHIYDVYRLRVLENIYKTGEFQGLCYVGANKCLNKTLRAWCKSLGHEYRWQRTNINGGADSKIQGKKLSFLPYPVQAVIFGIYFLFRRLSQIFIFGKGRASVLPNADLVILTYFPGFDKEMALKGDFRSSYWGGLHSLINEMGLKVNWIWFYSKSSQLSFQESAGLRWSLNQKTPETGQRYLLLEDRLTIQGIIAAFLAYLKMLMVSFCLRNIQKKFTFSEGSMNFFDILKDDWYHSLRGSGAMNACINASAFRDIFRDLPDSTKCLLYLWENIGWEQALLYTWQAQKNSPAIAVDHVNTCTASLFLRTYLGNDPIGKQIDRPLPDRLVTYGSKSRQILVEWGWPPSIAIEAEALRYLQLAGKYGTERRSLLEDKRHLLVITSATRDENAFQLSLLHEAYLNGGLDSYSQITIKPHPDMPVDSIMSNLSFDVPIIIENRPLFFLFSTVDVVYVANATSAGVEAAWVGLPLILVAAIGGVNLSSLKGYPDVKFVANVQELIKQLKQPLRLELTANTYLLDRELPRWKALLSEYLV